MQFVHKLLRIDATTSAKITALTRSLGKGKDAAPEQVKLSRAFAWVLKGGSVPKEELEEHRRKISALGRAEADVWLEGRRAAYQTEVERITAATAKLREKGFESFAPNDSQTILLLLKWAVENSPASVLLPTKEELDELLPRTPPDGPPDGPPTNTKAKKATSVKSRRS